MGAVKGPQIPRNNVQNGKNPAATSNSRFGPRFERMYPAGDRRIGGTLATAIGDFVRPTLVLSARETATTYRHQSGVTIGSFDPSTKFTFLDYPMALADVFRHLALRNVEVRYFRSYHSIPHDISALSLAGDPAENKLILDILRKHGIIDNYNHLTSSFTGELACFSGIDEWDDLLKSAIFEELNSFYMQADTCFAVMFPKGASANAANLIRAFKCFSENERPKITVNEKEIRESGNAQAADFIRGLCKESTPRVFELADDFRGSVMSSDLPVPVKRYLVELYETRRTALASEHIQKTRNVLQAFLIADIQRSHPEVSIAQARRMVTRYLDNTLKENYAFMPTKTAKGNTPDGRVHSLAEKIFDFSKMEGSQMPDETVLATATHEGNICKSISVKVKSKHQTELFCKIAEKLASLGIRIVSFSVDSIDSDDISICEIEVNSDGGPLSDVQADEATRAVNGLTAKVLGKKSLFDILGPLMTGPSSSHTAGANRIGQYARNFILASMKLGIIPADVPLRLSVDMGNTFSLNQSGRGHYSHVAVVGGLQGKKEDSGVLVDSLQDLFVSRFMVDFEGRKADLSGKEDGSNLVLTHRDNKFATSIRSIEKMEAHENTIVARVSWGDKGEYIEFAYASVGGGNIALQWVAFKSGDQVSTIKDPNYDVEASSIRGNKPTYMLKADGPDSVQSLRACIENMKDIHIATLESAGNIGRLCLSRELTAAEIDLIRTSSACVLSEVKPIMDLISTPPDTLFNSVQELEQKIASGQFTGISDAAIAYEMMLTPRKPGESNIQLRDRVFGKMDTFRDSMLRVFMDEAIARDSIVIERPCVGGLYKRLVTGNRTFPVRTHAELKALMTQEQRLRELAAEEMRGGRTARYTPSPEWRMVFSNPLVKAEARSLIRTSDILRLSDPQWEKLHEKLKAAWMNNPFLDTPYSRASAYAMTVAVHNAGNGRIAAAPTAGSCGILPGVLKSVVESMNERKEGAITDSDVTQALFTASLIGLFVNNRLRTAGATGGCQAEVGVATAMSAAAAAQLLGGNADEILNAAATAMQNLEGLVCDPPEGFVVIPCIPRNGMGATVALEAAFNSVSGIPSAISFDDMIQAYVDVASKMHPSLKETGKDGGICTTCSGGVIGKALKEQVIRSREVIDPAKEQDPAQ